MANLNDVTSVIASALAEVSMSGKLDVQMDGEEQVVVIGDKGEDVVVTVLVAPAA